MIIHEITLDGYAVQCAERQIRLGTAGSYGVEALRVMRKGEWVDYDIIIAFHPPKGKPVKIRLESDNVVDVPPEATAVAGTGELTFAGYADGVRQISVSQIYRVTASAGTEGIAPAEPTPELVQQILSAANGAVKTADGVREDMDKVLEAELGRETAEADRAEAESERVKAEAARAEAEADRAAAEKERQTAEGARIAAEDDRQSAETARAKAETARESAETDRATAESSRVKAEAERADYEKLRKDHETQRITDETVRQTAESKRQEAETARADAESKRAAAEKERQAAANSAATKANAAAEGAENVNISATQTTTGADITVTNREGEQTTVHIDTLTAVNTWEDVKNAVRLGLGEKLFPVGYEFTTLDADTMQNIIWVVRAHDHHTAANNKLTHTMTLETKNVYSLSGGTQKSVQYDEAEAFFYAEQELAAGTYNITIANQDWYPADNGKTFQFELTKALPAGGQLVFAMTYNATLEGKSVKSYANKTTTTALETVTLTEGSEGTSLGTTDGSSPNVNHMHRVIFGSNNYAQSAVRQWLNSAAAAGSVWTPTNVFDRPALTSYNGFMHGLPADFLAVMQPAVLACRTNSLFEVASLDGTAFAINQLYSLKADKFFLLSRPEIFGDWDSASYKDGTQLEYYNGLTATERIKCDAAGTARGAWLRSPHPSNASLARLVQSSGRVDSSIANNGYGVAPACIIA